MRKNHNCFFFINVLTLTLLIWICRDNDEYNYCKLLDSIHNINNSLYIRANRSLCLADVYAQQDYKPLKLGFQKYFKESQHIYEQPSDGRQFDDIFEDKLELLKKYYSIQNKPYLMKHDNNLENRCKKEKYDDEFEKQSKGLKHNNNSEKTHSPLEDFWNFEKRDDPLRVHDISKKQYNISEDYDTVKKIYDALQEYNKFEEQDNSFYSHNDIDNMYDKLKYDATAQKLFNVLKADYNFENSLDKLNYDDITKTINNLLKYDNSNQKSRNNLKYNDNNSNTDYEKILKGKKLNLKKYKFRNISFLSKIYRLLKRIDAIYETEILKSLELNSYSQYKLIGRRKKNNKLRRIIKNIKILSPVISMVPIVGIFLALKLSAAAIAFYVMSFFVIIYFLYKYRKCIRWRKISRSCEKDQAFIKHHNIEKNPAKPINFL
ncbi:Pv-fam-d protein [Plasmodium malariae]|uniref:Pv-fam-d protein n=1 Tax=Plasmodium malariae TaxID=5858 RepID=A0A1A8X1G6_PLAMA|nr:Pv-fam-d protein [Plasmodium malariae]